MRRFITFFIRYPLSSKSPAQSRLYAQSVFTKALPAAFAPSSLWASFTKPMDFNWKSQCRQMNKTALFAFFRRVLSPGALQKEVQFS